MKLDDDVKHGGADRTLERVDMNQGGADRTVERARAAQDAAVSSARRANLVAGALWSRGLVPESEAEMARALRVILDAWTPTANGADGQSGAGLDAPAAEGALAALARAGYSNIGRLETALTAASAAQTPPTEVTFSLISGECERLIRFTARALLTPEQIRRRRLVARVGLAGALLIVALASMRLWLTPHATASAVYGPGMPAAHVIDGDEATEWLLRDNEAGSVDITFPVRRTVRAVHIVNAHNRTFLDRAARDVRVTAFARHQVLGTAAGSFASLTAERSVLTLPLVAEGVTRLRVEVLSFFGVGGGVAEVVVK